MATIPGSPFDAQAQFDKVVPTVSFMSRVKAILNEKLSVKLMRTMGAIPGLGGLRRSADEARLQVFHSDSSFMANWFWADFGTPDKPASLAEMPWEYIEEYQDEVPFFGLREYWYPAMKSEELGNNEHKPATMLGDNLVFFRDEDGNPAALENRCPHRNPLLTLGQVNVWETGTITCRYHGATFNSKGDCVAFLADGPDSPACGKMKARAYPATELGGIIWVYMGDKEPRPILDQLPNADKILNKGLVIVARKEMPYSYLNLLDNTVDMSHVGCLHRTCLMFGDQKVGGGVDYEELGNGGIHAFLEDVGGHAGGKFIDEIQWYLPNLVFHGDEMMGGNLSGGWFWFVPRTAGSFVAWQIASINVEKAGQLKGRFLARMLQMGLDSGEKPGTACFIGGDAPIQMAQGRVARWDQEQLARTDRAVVKVRQMMKEAHKAEIEYRKSKGLQELPHPVSGYRSGARQKKAEAVGEM